jgi:hypothetical protein
MATILSFDQSRCRMANHAVSESKSTSGPAEILMFTGVRREPLYSLERLPQPIRHAPMFDDSAPDKPTGRKRSRSKNG